jgi:hypothetical protein
MSTKTIYDCYVQIDPPNEDTGYPGRVAEGKYVVNGDTVTLTDHHGNPLKAYSKKIEPSDNPLTIARRLTKQFYFTRRGGKNDFNRPLDYPPLPPWM